MTEINGESWNPTAHQQDRPPQVRRVHHSGTSKSSTEERKVVRFASGIQRCFRRNAGHDSRTLWKCSCTDSSEPNVEMQEQAAGGSAPSSSGGLVPDAGRPVLEDANRKLQSAAGQPTSSVVRTLEAEDHTSAKRLRLMAGMPILHETDVDVNTDAHKLVVLAATPTTKDSGLSGSMIGTGNTTEPRVEPCYG